MIAATTKITNLLRRRPRPDRLLKAEFEITLLALKVKITGLRASAVAHGRAYDPEVWLTGSVRPSFCE